MIPSLRSVSSRGAVSAQALGPSAASSTIVAGVGTIANDNTATSPITATVKDSAGVALTGHTPVVTSNGTGNTISALTETGSTGVWTGTFKSSVAETKTLSLSVGGRTAASAATVIVTASVVNPTVTSLTPTQGSFNGGTVIAGVGTGFQGGMTGTLGGEALDDLVVGSDTAFTAVTPAHAVGAVSLVLTNTDTGTVTKTTYFTFVAVTVYASQAEDGTLTGWENGGGYTVASADQTRNGNSKSIKCYDGLPDYDSPPKAAYGALRFIFSGATKNPALNDPDGVTVDWWIYIPADTITNISSSHGQIKLQLFRAVTGLQRGWIMPGVGYDFGGGGPPYKSLGLNDDQRTGAVFQDFTGIDCSATWRHIQIWQHRIDATGYVKIWVDDVLKDTVSGAGFGSSDDTAYYVSVGQAYSQLYGPAIVYVDSATIYGGKPV
jgi:hypothetical protein